MGMGAPIVVALALLSFSKTPLRAETSHEQALAIAKLGVKPAPPAASSSPSSPSSPAALLAGLDLTKMTDRDGTFTAPVAEKRIAKLTVDPVLQRVADGVMALHRVPEAAVVLMDVATGKLLVYASHVEKGPARDLCVEATAPAASVFKVVTGSALVETAGLTADQRECYSGGEQRIVQQDLSPDPKRDRWCTTLGGAMGRSINTVFARLALQHLKPPTLEATARSLGFGGAGLAFDVPVQPSAAHFPEEPLAFARTAAGFWNTTLSPLHAAWLSATIARGGEPVRPLVVDAVEDEGGRTVWTAPRGVAQGRVLRSETAQAVTTMMDSTVSDGTSYRAFHDPKGTAFLPNVSVAGKTGTLTDPTSQRLYTWFTGFAPSRPMIVADDGAAPPRQVAVGVLVVNDPTWTIKANVLAREVLRAYFAAQKVPNVSTPQLRASQPSTTPGKKHRRQRGS